MTWEHPGDGGDSQQVQAELEEGVKQIFSTNGALAALRADGSVKTCGHPDDFGDDFQQVRAEVEGDVQPILSTGRAFAVVKADE